MGCWDIFCFLCGNTAHTPIYTNDSILENIDDYEKNKGNKHFKAYYKPIYSIYKKNPEKFMKKIDEFKKNKKWLSKCTFLCANNKIVHGCKEISCNIQFRDKNNNQYTNSTYYNDNYYSLYGVFVHTDCWKFINKEYKIKLNYSHLPINVFNSTSPKIFDFINYGVIEKYWKQDFDFIQMIIENNDKLCDSPLKSTIVAKNIKKIFTKLKIRTENTRISPSVSATFYNSGIYKIGNNTNIWTIKSGKWVELKNTIKQTVSKIKKVVYIGDVNTKPIFVLDEQKNSYTVLTIS